MPHTTAQHPQRLSLFMYDDTGAMSFPHLTNRDYKNLSHRRLQVVPWLVHDFSRQKRDYVYMVKNRFPKGANRIITELHAAVRRLKSDYPGTLTGQGG